MNAPVEVPEDIVERIRALCLALPEVTVRIDYARAATRSTAYSYDIRRGSFCLLVARTDRAGRPAPLLVLRAGPEDRAALLSHGYPFFASRAGRDRVAVMLTDATDWEEIRELVTDSYRILAPKKLTALLDQHGDHRTRRNPGAASLESCCRRSRCALIRLSDAATITKLMAPLATMAIALR